jgi:hypothetical protein
MGLASLNILTEVQTQLKIVDPKILNFCMRLGWSSLNNFLNCADFKFQIEFMIKILGQIQI